MYSLLRTRIAALVICLLFTYLSASSKTWYVNQSAFGTLKNGHFWNSALNHLNVGIDSAKAGDTVKVAAGNYVPGGHLEASYILKSGVILLGGYSPIDSTSPRNFSLFHTILNGMHGNQGVGKVRHVVRVINCNSQTVLDGFIIQGGYASGFNGTQYEAGGAILFRLSSTAQIVNCLIRNNGGVSGGALFIHNSAPSLINCVFKNNSAFGSGTAFVQGSGGTKFLNCLFADNLAGQAPGIETANSIVSIINTTFFRNSVVSGPTSGNGIIIAGSGSTVDIHNSIFFANVIMGSLETADISQTTSNVNINNTITQNYPGNASVLNGANPRFHDTSDIAGPDNNFFTNDDGLQLKAPCSPGLNTGNNSVLQGTVTDITSRPRVYNNVSVDMGAYETQIAPTTPNKVAYVSISATGNNDGSSWQHAFNNLQDALLYCADTIKIAAGTYFPSTNNPLSSFWLYNKIVILGGYPSIGNPDEASRNHSVNVTRLSGALPGSNGIKSGNVVICNWVDSTCIVDGLVISDAKGPIAAANATALRVTNKSNPVFRHCTVENNYSDFGSAMQSDMGSSPGFFQCKFLNNKSDGRGGAIFVKNQSRNYFKLCEFSNNNVPQTNTLDGNGGAGAISFSNAVFDSCVFRKNSANYNGGALILLDMASASFNGCRFYGNSSRNAGGDVYIKASDATFGNCLFSDSTANFAGGSIYNENASPIFTRCEFRGGRATYGGAIYNDGSNPTFRACVFFANFGSSGGVFFNENNSHVTVLNSIATHNSASPSGTFATNSNSRLDLINCTLVKNIAQRPTTSTFSTVIRNAGATAVFTARNTIFWANQHGLSGSFTSFFRDIENVSGSTSALNNSVTQVYGTNGANNNKVGVNPKLVNYEHPDGPDGKFLTIDDGVRLAPCSQLINGGENSYLSGSTTDIVDNPRIHKAIVDIGAYEYQGDAENRMPVYVKKSAIGINNGSSWQNAYPSLHAALENTCADTIKVAEGTFYTAVTSIDSSFSVKQGVVLFGGYPASGSPDNSDRNPQSHPVILSGNVGNPNDVFDNAAHVVALDLTDGAVTLDGLTIQDGFQVIPGGDVVSVSGAGVHIYGSDVTIRNCIIQHNSTTLEGGGIYVSGDAIFNLQKSIIRKNQAAYGGGLSISGGATIENTAFEENSGTQYGGGLLTRGRNVRLTNNIFYKNWGMYGGGGVYHVRPVNVVHVNSTLVYNIASNYGGGGAYVIQNNDSEAALFWNCIFYENVLGSSTQVQWANAYYTRCSSFNDYCWYNIFSNTLIDISNTTNAVYGNPAFRDINSPAGSDGQWFTADDGLQLTHCSVALDRGRHEVLTNTPTDIIDSIRIRNGIVDLGAYEFKFGLEGTGIVNAVSDSAVATREITDTEGWSHYFNGCKYLFSIQKNGKNLGSIGDGTLQLGVVTRSGYNSGQPVNMTQALFNPPGSSLYAANKYWFVKTSALITDSLLIRFPYSTIDFLDLKGINANLNSHEQLELYKASSYPYNLLLPSDSVFFFRHSGNPSTTTWKHIQQEYFHIAEFYIKNFSAGTIATRISAALPVTLGSYHANKLSNSARLTWTSLSEFNTDHYEIHKSYNGINYALMVKIPAKDEPGNYTTTDSSPFSGLNFYKLIQYDKDGASKVLGVRTLKFDQTGINTFNLFPNPISGNNLTVEFPFPNGLNTIIQVTNESGQTIIRKLVSVLARSYILSFQEKPPAGIYTVTVEQGGKKHSKMLVVLK